MSERKDIEKDKYSESIDGEDNQISTVQDPVLIFAKRYQAFFNSTTDGITIFNSRGEILDANPRFIKFTKTTYDQIVTKNITDIISENHVKEFQKYFNAVLKGQEIEHPVEYLLLPVSGKGKSKPVEINLSLLVNQYGYSKIVMAVIRDVTKKKMPKTG